MIDKAQLLADLKAARKQGLQPMVVRVGKGDDITIDAFADTGEKYTVWARTEENGDPLVVYFTPGKVPLSWLPYNAEMEVERNDRNQLEIKRPYTGLRDSLGGAQLPTNAYDWIHTHESDVEAGQLNASLVFDDGTVPVARGGTNIGSYAVGDIIYASGATTLSKLAGVATGNALISGGVNTAPAWGKIGLTTHVSGTLPVGSGGTNITTYTTGDILYASAANVLSKLAVGTNGHVLTLAAGVPTWAAASGGSPFTYAAPVIYPNNTTDVLTIGGTSNIGKVGIIGVADEPQLIVRGNGTQTSAILDIQNSSSESLFRVNATAIVFNEDSIDLDFRVESNGDANALSMDGNTGRISLGTTPGSARLQVVGVSDIPQLLVSGAPGQSTNPVVSFTDDMGNPLFLFNNDGSVVLDGTLSVNSTATAFLRALASTTSAASLRIAAGTAPTSPAAGDRWHDSAQQAMMTRVAGNTGSDVQGLFTQTALTGNNNTTAAVSMFGTGVTSRTIAANFFTIGKTLEIDVWGIYQTNGARDITWELKAGSTVLVSQGPISHNSGGTGARFWRGRFAIACYTTGASGTFWTQGEIILHDGTLVRFFNTTTNVLNTTTSHLLDLTWQYATSTSTTNAYAGIVSIKEIN